MKNKIKRTLLCLLAVSAMTVTGNIHADDDTAVTAEEVSSDGTAEDGSEEGTGERAKRKEADEKADFDVALAEKYLKKVGTEAGLDIYGTQTAASRLKSPITPTSRRLWRTRSTTSASSVSWSR